MNLKLILLVYISVIISNLEVLADDIDDLDEATVEVEDPETVDIPYKSPTPTDPSKVYFAEHFDNPSQFAKKWIKSQAKKEGISEDIAKYDGEWNVEPAQRDALIGDSGLVLKSKAKHAAISALLDKPFVFREKPLIVQYEVILQDGQDCGGAYLKLLSNLQDKKSLANFHDKSPYSIMFGPDKCGSDHKLHFIFKHKNPLNGTVEEKHCKKPQERLEDIYSDKLPHLYTLTLQPDNRFEIRIDGNVVNSGSLLEDFEPPVNPPKEIDDPNDKKPEDWDEREKIPDPEAVKPDDWDESAPAQIIDESATIPDGWLEDQEKFIPDPNAKKPEDWDTEMDGEWEPPLIENPACSQAPGCGKWEPPLIDNPEYRGKWRAPLIDNPNYKGKWRPRRIQNPNFYEDKEPFKMQSIAAVGFELWSMSKDIYFDNIIIADDMGVVEAWAQETYEKKKMKIVKDNQSMWGRFLKAVNYRPKSWGVYFIYCSIPFVLYIWYLWTCVKEESLIQRLAKLTNEYPLLWLLYIIVCGIPVAFVLYCCCRPSSKPNQEQEELKRTAEKKKTDETTPDTVEEVPEEQQEEENEKDIEEDNKPQRDEEKDSGSEYEDEEGEESPNVEQPPPSQSGEGDVPRKRKPRKE